MEIDVRGQACPIPVVKTRKAIETSEEGSFRVRLDSKVSAENVARTAEHMGCTVKRTEAGGEIVLEITRTGRAPAAEAACGPRGRTVTAYVNTNLMGRGDEQLGRILMKAFLQTLGQVPEKPSRAVFVNSGVFLTTEGSEHLEVLSALEKSGIEIISCGTCLDFYDLSSKLKVGRSTNMYEIVGILSGSDRVVQP